MTKAKPVTLPVKGPGWPDFRGWAAIGFFGLAFQSLYMIDKNPALLGIPSFMQFIGGLATGGVLLVASHLFGGTKSGAETNAKLAEKIGASAAPVEPKP